MKLAEFNALTTYNDLATVQALPAGTKFFWASSAGYRLTPDVHGKQASNTALRHRISYYVMGSDGVHRMVNDILEADATANQTKTATRKGKSTLVTRDDDDKRDIIGGGTWA
jgi:hypothetical protein